MQQDWSSSRTTGRSSGDLGWQPYGWSDSAWPDFIACDWEADKDKFSQNKDKDSKVTLGLKHPLTLDERKDLVYRVLTLGAPDVCFPRIGLFNWGARTVHAALMICSRAEPKTAVRSLRNKYGQYETEHAAKVLLESFQGLYPDQAERNKVVMRLKDNCYEKQAAIIDEAVQLGFVPGELEDKVDRGNRSDSRNGTLVAAPSVRSLMRRTTDEELESLKKTKNAR